MDVHCMRYSYCEQSELISIMKARIAEQPDMFITTLENYESLKNSQLNYTPNTTHNSQNNVKLLTSQSVQGVIKQSSQETATCIQESQIEVVCPICSASFSTVQQYESHERFCQVQCNICFKTVSKKYLKRHKRRTHMLYQFQCNLCSQETFSTKQGLKKHFKETHKKECIYKCPLCAKLIGTFIFFVKHVKNHQNSLKCGICDAKYACKKSIKNHIKLHHKELNSNIIIESEIKKTNEPVIDDYSKCIVNFEEESDKSNDNEEDTSGVDSTDWNEQISRNKAFKAKKTTCILKNLLQNGLQKYKNNTDSISSVKGLLENTDIRNKKSDGLLETLVVNVLSNDINKQNSSTNCIGLLKTGEDKAVADSSKLLKHLLTE